MHYQRWKKHGDPTLGAREYGRKVCGIGHCTRLVEGDGLCATHYRRLKERGDPLAPVRRFFTEAEALAELPDRTGGSDACWPWLGHVNKSGYGLIHSRPRVKSALAHRRVYEAEVGPIPDGLELDHLCRNRRCVNPRHLEPVTPAVNSQRGMKSFSLTGRCMKGLHDVTAPEAVRLLPNGNRICRQCRVDYDRQRTLRRREARTRGVSG